MNECLFCKIIAGTLPCDKVYEDEEVFAFHDIRPLAPVHFLLVPKRHIATLLDCGPPERTLLGKLLSLVPELARAQGLMQGFKTHINTGRAGGQEVWHVHVHVFGHPSA